jgi:hydroxyacylglutathione hydrolase
MRLFFNFSINELSNSYLVGPDEGNDAILIDPSQINLDLIERIETNKFNIAHVLITHRHTGHIKALKTLLKIYNPTVWAGEPELYDIEVNKVEDKKIYQLGSLKVEALHIPGHSIDSFVYKIENALFTGDVLLAGRIGSTEEIMEKALLLKGIKQRLLTMDEKLLIFPGHGTISSVKIEKLFNPELIASMAIQDLDQLSHPSIIT